MQEKEGKQETILDLAGCGTVAALHRRMQEAFGFPPHYGANLDALWDMGRDYLGDSRVTIRGLDALPPEVRAYFLGRAMRVLRALERETDGPRFLLEE